MTDAIKLSLFGIHIEAVIVKRLQFVADRRTFFYVVFALNGQKMEFKIENDESVDMLNPENAHRVLAEKLGMCIAAELMRFECNQRPYFK